MIRKVLFDSQDSTGNHGMTFANDKVLVSGLITVSNSSKTERSFNLSGFTSL